MSSESENPLRQTLPPQMSELPPALQPEGPIDQRLQDARRTIAEQHVAILNRLVYDLGQIRRNYVSTVGTSQESSSDHCLHLALLGRWEHNSHAVRVLRYCVAWHEGLNEYCDDHWDDALGELLRNFEAYDTILGDLLAADLKDAASETLAAWAYSEGTHSTAAHDFNVFVDIVGYQRDRTDDFLGVPTGLPMVDMALNGLRGLSILGSDKGVGKTTFALNIVPAALRANPDLAVLFYSLDMPKTRLFARMVCCEANVDYRSLYCRERGADETRRITEASDRLQRDIFPRMRIVEHFGEDNKLSFEKVVTDCDALRKATGASDLLLIFDLFQRMDVPDEIGNDLDRDNYRLDVLMQLQARWRSPRNPDGFPIVVCSQVRKSDGYRRELTRDDLHGSGRIASDADSVLLMWPLETGHRSDDGVVPLLLRIDKGRDGVERRDINLWFWHTRSQFTDFDPRVMGQPSSQSSSINPLAGGM